MEDVSSDVRFRTKDAGFYTPNDGTCTENDGFSTTGGPVPPPPPSTLIECQTEAAFDETCVGDRIPDRRNLDKNIPTGSSYDDFCCMQQCGCTDSYDHFGQADCQAAGCCWDANQDCSDTMVRRGN